MGTSWLTVFSPRIQNYTLTVTPSNEWVNNPQSSVTTSWLGRAKGGPASLFRRSYRYADDATGLEDVPLQVWSTKGFTANWSVPFGPRPPVAATLFHPPDRPDAVVGKIMSQIPGVNLTDVQLVYRNQILPLGDLFPGVPQAVASKETAGQVLQWLQPMAPDWGSAVQAGRRAGPTQATSGLGFRIWPAVFYEPLEASAGSLRGAAMRGLDQSWRLSAENRDEVILLARIAPGEGKADEVNRQAEVPTRLWVGALPSSGEELPTLAGQMRQETFVRVYIPIARPADSAKP
jgi:hypothetical protein